MKRKHSFLLVLAFWILLCAGCGLTTSSSTDYPAALMVDGEIYLFSVVPMAGEVDESAIIGYTESYTNEYPKENGQTNFSRELGMPYARVDGGIAVLYQNEWHLCIPENERLKDTVVQTFAAEDKEGRLQTYYQMANGTWKTDDYSYLYKLELTGRMHNAAKDSTFICLSNSEDVSFSKVSWSMLSSNMEDRLDRKEVVIVEMLIVENVSPTPTLAPGQDQALPTTMIDGEIYFMSGMYATTKPSEISRIKEIIEQAEYLGMIATISVKEYPTKDLESNCLEEGCEVYRYADGERINFIVVRPNGLTYRYVSGWTKYQWFENKLIKEGEQEYLKTGIPTPTVTPVPTPNIIHAEQEDLLILLETNYDGQIPASASSPYVLPASASNCMIVFGQGATTLIYVTGDDGTTWEQAEIPEAGGHQHAIVTCATAISDTTYCIGYRYWGEYDGTNFYLTEDCGKTWARLLPEVAIPEEITANMRYAEAVAVKYVGDKLQVQVSCKTTVFPPWSIEVTLESADLGKTWSVVEIWEKETDEE